MSTDPQQELAELRRRLRRSMMVFRSVVTVWVVANCAVVGYYITQERYDLMSLHIGFGLIGVGVGMGLGRLVNGVRR